MAVDANRGWSVDDAISFARLIEHLDIVWFEEPCHWDDDAYAMARVRQATRNSDQRRAVRNDQPWRLISAEPPTTSTWAYPNSGRYGMVEGKSDSPGFESLP